MTKVILYILLVMLGFGLGGLIASEINKPVTVLKPVYIEREVNAMLL